MKHVALRGPGVMGSCGWGGGGLGAPSGRLGAQGQFVLLLSWRMKETETLVTNARSSPRPALPNTETHKPKSRYSNLLGEKKPFVFIPALP